MQCYVLTYYRVRKKELLIALGSYQAGGGEGGRGGGGGAIISASAGQTKLTRRDRVSGELVDNRFSD